MPTERDLGTIPLSATQANEIYWFYFVRVDVPLAVGPQRFTDHPNGDQSLNIDGGVKSITITNQGSGYGTPPAVSLDAPPAGGIQATAVATVGGGLITGITIVNPGAGYTSNPAVAISGGGGTGGAASASVTGTWVGSDGNDVQVGQLDQGQQNVLSVSSISFANLNYQWTNWANMIFDNGVSGLRGALVQVWQVWFDSANALQGGVKIYEGTIDNHELGDRATFALKPHVTSWARIAPWAIPSPTCIYPYKDPLTCQYVGAEPATESTCGKTRASCTLRGNQAHFGGVDFMPKIGEVIHWGDQVGQNNANGGIRGTWRPEPLYTGHLEGTNPDPADMTPGARRPYHGIPRPVEQGGDTVTPKS